MDVVLWIAVGICLFVIVAAAAVVLAAALAGIRGVKAMRTQLVSGLEQMNASMAELEARLEGLSGKSAEAQKALDELSESLRKVSVVLSATHDVRDLVGGVRGFVPKK